MENAEIEFIDNGAKTVIQCNINDKMKDICKKFREKANIREDIAILYSYNGKVGFNEELSFQETANIQDKERNKMNILVYEQEEIINKNDNQPDNMILNQNILIKSENIICPKCKETIKMDIKDYKINLSDCINKHNFDNILLNEFDKTQEMDLRTIICDICQKSNKSITYNNEFNKCLTCDKNICPLCKQNHDKEHKIINYDKKYYICNKHNENYNSYCEDCKINICTLCDMHKDHKKINFIDILPNKEDLNKKKKELKEAIISFDNSINMLINILNEVKDKIDIYYKINEDIINNYDDKNRNYETLFYLNQFKNNNIINDLNKIVESDSIKDKFNNVFNLYSKMNIDEISINYEIKEYHQKQVKIFGKEFVERNKKNCKIIIDGKEQDLKEIHTFGFFFGTDKDSLNIKLKGITNITSMSNMFDECISLSGVPDIHKWNTSNITNMSGIFKGCTLLSSLPDISKWNLTFVTNISKMFFKCNQLFPMPDISNWKTSNVTNMSHLFDECRSITSLPDISKWDTSNVTDMSYMFDECSSLTSIPDISKWNTNKVTNMRYMFCGCNSLKSFPDISRWNNSENIDKSCMFLKLKEF